MRAKDAAAVGAVLLLFVVASYKLGQVSPRQNIPPEPPATAMPLAPSTEAEQSDSDAAPRDEKAIRAAIAHALSPEGDDEFRRKEAIEAASFLDVSPAQRKLVADAQFNLTWQLREVERWEEQLQALTFSSEKIVKCGLRNNTWRAALLGRARVQFDMNDSYARAKAAITPVEKLAAAAQIEYTNPNIRWFYLDGGCAGLADIPFLAMYDRVVIGVDRLPEPSGR